VVSESHSFVDACEKRDRHAAPGYISTLKIALTFSWHLGRSSIIVNGGLVFRLRLDLIPTLPGKSNRKEMLYLKLNSYIAVFMDTNGPVLMR
jgi:hypothetical protein